MRVTKVILLLLIITAIVKFDLPCIAQLQLNEIDLSRIPQKKVRNLVQQQSLNGSKFFVDLKPSCYSESDSSNYSFQQSTHVIKETILKVWNKLMSLKPKEEFSGKMVSFGFLYSKKLNKIYYADDDKKDIEEGEVMFLNLKLLGGVKNIGVALEVTKVDEINKLIQFCYLNNGMTEGTQQIQLTGSDDGNTVITQETRYRNKSKFREKRLYPLFHQKAVNEMHSNLSRLIEGF
ncbi:MAG: hypothetical protein AB9846_04485 [Tenuifilaceae bacterium]